MNYSLRILLFIVALAFIFPSYAQKEYIKTVSGKPIKITDLELKITQVMDSIKLPGLSIAIINDAQIAYYNTFGVTNNQTNEPVTKQHIFEAASLSKPVFAYFVMKMVEHGDLDLDIPIYNFLKEIIPEKAIDSSSLVAYKTITPRMVLSHSTGIPNWVNNESIKIAFTPGTDFSYSGEAYQHLAAALGTKLGIGWGSKLDSLFIKEAAHPLKMNSSFYTWNDTLETYKVKGHSKGVVNLEIHRDKNVGSGYSLHSNALDYANFLIEMMQPKHLKSEIIDEMLKEQNHFKPDNELLKETGQTGWGLGFAQKPTPNGLMHLHTGNNHDFQAYAMMVPKQKYGIVIFANSDNLFAFLIEIEKLIETQF